MALSVLSSILSLMHLCIRPWASSKVLLVDNIAWMTVWDKFMIKVNKLVEMPCINKVILSYAIFSGDWQILHPSGAQYDSENSGGTSLQLSNETSREERESQHSEVSTSNEAFLIVRFFGRVSKYRVPPVPFRNGFLRCVYVNSWDCTLNCIDLLPTSFPGNGKWRDRLRKLGEWGKGEGRSALPPPQPTLEIRTQESLITAQG